MQIDRTLLNRRTLLTGGLAAASVTLAGCAPQTSQSSASAPSGTPAPATLAPTPSTPQEIAARATVPVLCYHQVRPWTGADSSYARDVLVVEPATYRRQLDAIKAAGYTTIAPAEYHAHLATGAKLPDKPVILSFDDGKDNQALTALPELAKRGMVGTWFIMTVVIGNSGWTSADQIRQAADAGHTIGCHTWDHHDVRKYGAEDFATQVNKARATLQKHSGQAVDSFAFPYGAWNAAALPHLASAGFTTAYQLADKPLDPALPQYTLRRQLAVSTWTGEQVVAKLDDLRG